jgi:excisionase family DNA binding protein
MTDPLEDYVDAADAASRLRIHPESVKRLIRQGKLPARKIANKWFIRRDILEQFASNYDPRPGRRATLI